MPTISSFYGLSIRMHWNEHAPPHFHVVYGEHEAVIRIHDLEMESGSLPREARRLTLEWATLHQSELIDNWNLCAKRLPPKRILPLE